MKSQRTPHVATGVTSEKLTVTFGPSAMKYKVDVPAATRCVKLDGGSNCWVVDDLSFIEDKRGLLYSDADIYGIRIAEDKISDIKLVEPTKSRPSFGM